MATAKKDVTGNRVQGHLVHPLDKMIAIAVRIAEREGLLLDEDVPTTGAAGEAEDSAAEDAREQGPRTA